MSWPSKHLKTRCNVANVRNEAHEVGILSCHSFSSTQKHTKALYQYPELEDDKEFTSEAVARATRGLLVIGAKEFLEPQRK